MTWVLGLAAGAAAASAGTPTTYGFTDRQDGISSSFFDVGLLIPWDGGQPAWSDAEGRAGGSTPFASDVADARDRRRVRRLEITRLALSWWSGQRPHHGLILRLHSGSGVDFISRESSDPALRPQLRLEWADGNVRFVEPVADATLDRSTYRGLGTDRQLSARGHTWVALRFDMTALQAASPSQPTLVELVLVRASEAHGAYRLDLFELRPPFGGAVPLRADGVARRYTADAGIGNDPDVLFADSFESRHLDGRWKQGAPAAFDIIDRDASNGFRPVAGRALRIVIRRGQQLGLDLRYRFRDQLGSEPVEVYFRYYLRLAQSWFRAAEGGKLPGLAGTYGQAGWGGRPWHGHKGWSLRGSYGTPPPLGHPAHGRLLLGTYAYHSRSTGYGEGFGWLGSAMAGLIEPDRWYCIEQRVRLNTPGNDDGVLQVWIDGRPVLSRVDLRLRDVDRLRIEEVWMNFFHGGMLAAPADMHAYIDAVVVARRYIGPMGP